METTYELEVARPEAAPDLFRPTPVTSFVGNTLPEPRWAVRGIWPQYASGVIGGKPKARKSTLAAELAISLATGTPMFALEEFSVENRPQPVLYIQQENADARVQRDFQRIFAARGLGEICEVQEDVPVLVGGEVETETLTYESFEYTPAAEGWESTLPRFDVMSHAGFDLSNPEHTAWLSEYVKEHGFRYVFLDPLYQLIGVVDERDSAELRPLLQYLTQLKNQLGCAVVVTHHMSDKKRGGQASALLGSTYIHGWYEAAMLVSSTEAGVTTVRVDAQRDIGTTEEYALYGTGVGRWSRVPQAEGLTDSAGRAAPQSAGRMARLARLEELIETHGDSGVQPSLRPGASRHRANRRALPRRALITTDVKSVGDSVIRTRHRQTRL